VKKVVASKQKRGYNPFVVWKKQQGGWFWQSCYQSELGS
jgi:hypothetical protein